MKVYVKGLNSCVMRKRNLCHYREYLIANGHELVSEPAESDFILIWTCGFRADVRDNSLEQVVRYEREYSAKVILIMMAM